MNLGGLVARVLLSMIALKDVSIEVWKDDGDKKEEAGGLLIFKNRLAIRDGSEVVGEKGSTTKPDRSSS